MLIMAHLGKSIANSNSVSFLKHFSVQFCSITKLEERLICKGEVSKLKKIIKKNYNSKLKVLNLLVKLKFWVK